MQTHHLANVVALSACTAMLAACNSGGDNPPPVATPNPLATRPNFLLAEPIRKDYDGQSGGLVTGSAKDLAGLLTFKLPDNTEPSAAALRTLQIQTAYTGLLDVSSQGGFGSYFGKLDPRANQGSEYFAVIDDGSGQQNVAVAVQIPSHFNPEQPCMVTATSSGSRGVYGEVPVVGEWGLNKGCAVVYTDKGTGTGAHDLDRDRGYALDGALVTAGQRKDLTFNINLLGEPLAAYRAANPNRFALKHAHSRQNPEKDWGLFTLQAIKVGFYALNLHFSTQRYTAGNTTVIASSISNGAGAALRAAEQDTEGLIDGVAVGEPQVNLPDNALLTVQRGGLTLANSGKPLYDYVTYANLYQPCAVLAPSVVAKTVFIDPKAAANRCAGLAQQGLVSGTTLADQAADALAKLRAYGWEPETDLLHDAHYGFEFTNLVATTYASAYARASVSEAVCGYSVGGVGATTPGAPAEAGLKTFWSSGSGLASGVVTIINDRARGGASKDATSISASSGLADFNLEGALCLRRLLTGAQVGKTLPSAAEATLAARVRTGMAEVRVNGNLRGKPTIIVHGRTDALLPVSHTSRPYMALNRRAETNPDVRYYEVTDANHFDALVNFYPRTLVPLVVYGQRALDLMHARLTTQAALPPSQVVRAVARVSPAQALSDSNLPPIVALPTVMNTIVVTPGAVAVPE